MLFLQWDASGLVKKFVPESGSDVVEALYAALPTVQHMSTAVGYAEMFSILLRTRNRGAIDQVAFELAADSLRAELIDDPDFVLLAISDDAFYRGMSIMKAHNINSTDAAILILFQDHIQNMVAPANAKFLLVASDQKLVSTAQALGLQAVNPQMMLASDVPAFLAGL